MDVSELVKLSIALIAIIDVPGNIPMFLQRTASMSPGERRLTAVVSAIATVAILLSFAHAGEPILETFGITIDAFRILGGLVVLLIALDMLGLLGASAIAYGDEEEANPVVTGVFPLAVPLFAGPGAISAVMIYAHEMDQYASHDVYVSLIIVVVGAFLCLGLLLASVLGRLIGPVAQNVMNRLLGIIVGSLGVEFILEGLAGFFAAPPI